MDVQQVFEAFSMQQQRSVSPATFASRMSLLRHWAIPALSDRDISTVTSSDINHIYDAMEAKGLKSNSLFGAYAAFSSFFSYAVSCGYIEENPVSSGRRYRRIDTSSDSADAQTPDQQS